jgi:hypothetical protein
MSIDERSHRCSHRGVHPDGQAEDHLLYGAVPTWGVVIPMLLEGGDVIYKVTGALLSELITSCPDARFWSPSSSAMTA